MSRIETTRIVLASRPEGEPKQSDFRLERAPVPDPGDGEVLLETLYLSLDPYMRGRMSAAKSYAKPVEIGAVMEGEVVARVVASRHAGFAPGDVVLARSGWQTHAVAKGEAVRKAPAAAEPVSTALGVLGMPGLTAYVGLANIGKPKPGETVVVAAATGPVGSAVGQIAKLRGARTVGIAGGPEKVKALTEVFGFDVALDTARRTSPSGSRRPARTASTSISRTSAARCSTRCYRSSTPSPASPSAGASRTTTIPRHRRGRTAYRR
jgi:NADPH-dependent curcumin reductase CurA